MSFGLIRCQLQDTATVISVELAKPRRSPNSPHLLSLEGVDFVAAEDED